jgi:hypothetical protein
MSMTYLQIQDSVIANGFTESDRTSVQRAIQFRHAWLWDLEDWAFRYGTDTVTFTSSSQTVGSVPSDFHAVVALYDTNGNPVRGVADHREFFDQFNAESNLATGAPSFYTVLAGSIGTGRRGR